MPACNPRVKCKDAKVFFFFLFSLLVPSSEIQFSGRNEENGLVVLEDVFLRLIVQATVEMLRAEMKQVAAAKGERETRR